MSSSGESGAEQETCCAHVIKTSPHSSPASSPDLSLIKCEPANDTLSEGESEANENKVLPARYLNTSDPEGVLTPPNETEVCRNGTDVSITAGKSNGRLAIFKEGILCLELSHEDEGDSTKWLKVKSRSVYPNVVRVTKEVTIPGPSSVQPTMFTSPSHCSAGNSSSRVESCTSHSMSDDGSSMVSSESPRLMCRSWRKQSVPQKNVSSCLQFYMKPPSCFVNLKRKIRRQIPAKALERNRRRPYELPDLSYIFNFSSASSGLEKDLCLCKNSDVKILPVISDLSISVNEKVQESGKPNLKLGLQELIRKLTSGAEEKLRLCMSNDLKSISYILGNHMGSPSKSKSSNSCATPRKRNSTEFQTEDSAPRYRPMKKSPAQSFEKTILTVPGVGVIAGKKNSGARHNRPPTNKSPVSLSASIPPSLVSYTYDAADGHIRSIVSSSPPQFESNTNVILNGNASPQKLSSNQSIKNIPRAKLPSPSLLNSMEGSSASNKTARDLENQSSGIISSSSSSSRTAEPTPFEETLSPEEQQQFQQQAMSKAISYTINSLLGNGNSSVSSNSSDKKKLKADVGSAITKSAGYKNSLGPSSSASGSSFSIAGNLFGINEQDQNSFLRHLLDTSDPIPSSTTTSASPPAMSTSTSKASHSTQKTSERSAIINPIHKVKNISTSKLRRSPKASISNTLESPNPTSRSTAKSNGSRRPESASRAPNAQIPALVHVDPTHMSPYGYLLHPNHRPEPLSCPTGQLSTFQQHQHYAPLLPAHFIPKVMGHPYNVDFPVPFSANYNSDGETALNLSQRGGGWTNGLPSPNSSDRSSGGPEDLSMKRGSSRSRTDGNFIDTDVPLNLCKKKRPN